MRFSRIEGAGFSAFVALYLTLIFSLSAIFPFHPASPTPTPRPTDLGAALVTHHAFPSISYSIQAFLWWNPVLRQSDLEAIRLMRFSYVKQIFGWDDIEPLSPNQDMWTQADDMMDEADYRGIKMVARLGRPPTWAESPTTNPNEAPFNVPAFGAYCGKLAAHFKGRIVAYQVWNEPNLEREWLHAAPNASAYVKVLATCYKAIKAADPAAIVISAGLAPTGGSGVARQAIPDEEYLNAMYDAGMQNYYDVLGLNAPGFKSPPETPPDDPALDGQRWQAFRHVEDMRALMVARGDGAKQIAILEMGWTTDTRDTIVVNGTTVSNPYRWHAVTEKQQADYLVAAYNYAGQHWRPWIGLMSMIYLPDQTWTTNNEEYWWSIAEPGYNPHRKIAFIVLANMAHYIEDKISPAIDGAANYYHPLPPRPTK